MRTVPYSVARQKLSDTMIKTIEDHTPTLMTRRTGGDCVLISLDDYNSLMETAYLMRSPANAKHLIDSLEEARTGKIVKKGLITE